MSIAEQARFAMGLAEYVSLRLVRRFVFTPGMIRVLGRWIPYYRTNSNEVDARSIVEHYGRAFARTGRTLPSEAIILEIGSGATNAVGYALSEDGLAGRSARVVLFEPFAPLDENADRRHRSELPAGVPDRVRRTASLGDIETGTVDLVLSNSVLEHVRDPSGTFRELRRVLAPSGFMLHAVDYRDHFFKYPYHFLLFSERTWNRWLDPGDLPRWRLGDHVRHLEAAGFRVEIVESRTLSDEYAAVASHIDPRFDRQDPALPVALATLVAAPAA